MTEININSNGVTVAFSELKGGEPFLSPTYSDRVYFKASDSTAVVIHENDFYIIEVDPNLNRLHRLQIDLINVTVRAK